ncbi:hypothetical protein [Streptomyces sp. NPDC059076]|uniref:hypothetical protein n=1 Tax=unclassified Streptomyces TaxID=2593676 RepID=UPI0036D16D74
MSTPPKPGKGLSVRVDEVLYDDLAAMMRPGMTASDAVKHAVSIVAGAYRNAWAHQVVADGELPHITDCLILPDQACHTPGAVSHAPVEPRNTPADGRHTTAPNAG